MQLWPLGNNSTVATNCVDVHMIAACTSTEPTGAGIIGALVAQVRQ